MQYFNDKRPSITVVYKDARSVTYTYDWSSSVGAIRKDDALAVRSGEAIAFYTHNRTKGFTSARYYPNAKKWYLKSGRCRKFAAKGVM